MKIVAFWGYKNPVRTSQETHYVSATESSRFMLRNILSLRDGDCKEYRLLGCDAMCLLLEPTLLLTLFLAC
jgi:hypothetical protein